MNDAEFRAVLDWRMCSDPWPQDVPQTVIDDWIERLCHEYGYQNFVTAYHEFVPTHQDNRFGVGA